MNFKKIMVPVVLLAWGFSCIPQTAYADTMSDVLSRLSALESENATLKQKVERLERSQGSAPAGVAGTAIPAAKPQIQGLDGDPNQGMYVEADILVMKFSEGGVPYALNNTLTGGVGPNSSLSSVDADYETGYRIGAGYRMPWDDMEVFGHYTSIEGDGSNEINNPGLVTASAALTPDVASAYESIDAASATINYEYESVDLNAGRSYQMSPNTSIKFFAGPEYVKLDRDLDVFYSGAAVPTLNVHQHTDFNGWGARFGTEAAWSLFHGLSLKGGLIGSGVYGDVSSQMFEQGAAAGDRRIVQSDQIFVPILRADAGVNWAWDINPSLSLSLYAGYEFQQFFGIPLSNRFIDDVADGLSLEQETDISLSGWVFRAGLEF